LQYFSAKFNDIFSGRHPRQDLNVFRHFGNCAHT